MQSVQLIIDDAHRPHFTQGVDGLFRVHAYAILPDEYLDAMPPHQLAEWEEERGAPRARGWITVAVFGLHELAVSHLKYLRKKYNASRSR